MPNLSSMVTASEAAGILGRDVSTVNKMIRAGRLKAVKAFDGLRAPYLIERRDVERLLADRQAS